MVHLSFSPRIANAVELNWLEFKIFFLKSKYDVSVCLTVGSEIWIPKLISVLDFVTDLFYAVDQLAFLSIPIASITTMHAQICPGLCKPHFSLGTWLASAMVSSSCLEV